MRRGLRGQREVSPSMKLTRSIEQHRNKDVVSESFHGVKGNAKRRVTPRSRQSRGGGFSSRAFSGFFCARAHFSSFEGSRTHRQWEDRGTVPAAANPPATIPPVLVQRKGQRLIEASVQVMSISIEGGRRALTAGLTRVNVGSVAPAAGV